MSVFDHHHLLELQRLLLPSLLPTISCAEAAAAHHRATHARLETGGDRFDR